LGEEHKESEGCHMRRRIHVRHMRRRIHVLGEEHKESERNTKPDKFLQTNHIDHAEFRSRGSGGGRGGGSGSGGGKGSVARGGGGGDGLNQLKTL